MPDIGLILIVAGFIGVSLVADWRDLWAAVCITALLVGGVFFLIFLRIEALAFQALVYVPPLIAGLLGGIVTRALGLWIGRSTTVRLAFTGAGLIVTLAVAYFFL